MSETLGCGHPDKNRACGDCLDEAIEAIERARTFTGLEAEGCPLCAYVDGVFTESCSFHRKLQAMELQVGELQKAARALIDKLHQSWSGNDYAEYAFTEDEKSHPMADLEKLLPEERNGVWTAQKIAKLVVEAEKEKNSPERRQCTCAETKLHGGESAVCPWCIEKRFDVTEAVRKFSEVCKLHKLADCRTCSEI